MNKFVEGTVEVPRWIVNVVGPAFTLVIGVCITAAGWGIQSKVDTIGETSAESLRIAKDAMDEAKGNSTRLSIIESNRYTVSQAYSDNNSLKEAIRGVEREVSKLREEVARIPKE